MSEGLALASQGSDGTGFEVGAPRACKLGYRLGPIPAG